MKKMQNAKMEFVRFHADDVLTASGEVPATFLFSNSVIDPLTDTDLKSEAGSPAAAEQMINTYMSKDYGGLTWNKEN